MASSASILDIEAYTRSIMNMLVNRAVIGERNLNSTSLFILIFSWMRRINFGMTITLLTNVIAARYRSVGAPLSRYSTTDIAASRTDCMVYAEISERMFALDKYDGGSCKYEVYQYLCQVFRGNRNHANTSKSIVAREKNSAMVNKLGSLNRRDIRRRQTQTAR